MEDRPDLLLGVIVIHVAKQQQQQQQQQQQSVGGKAAVKTWMYSEQQERVVTESTVNFRTTPTTVSTPSIIRETDTIASPAEHVMTVLLFSVITQVV